MNVRRNGILTASQVLKEILHVPVQAVSAQILRGSQQNAAEAIRQAAGRRSLGGADEAPGR